MNFSWLVFSNGLQFDLNSPSCITQYGVLRPSTPRTVFTTIQFSPVAGSPHFFAGASDGVLSTFDLKTGDIVRKHRPPISRVLNAVDCVRGTGRELLLGAGDDGVARIWTVDSKEAIEEIDLGYPVTAAKWSLDGQQVFLGGIDNDIHCFDLRKKQVVYSLRGHTDTISGLSVSPSGSHLLSSSFDNTVRIWDIKPFAPVQQPGQLTSPRLHRTLMGAPAGFDSQLRKPAWDPSGDRVAVGAADRSVIIWDVETAQIRYKLPGHRGTVVAVEFSPKSDEPIIMSAGLDAQIVESFPTALGRLSSADVLSSFFHVQSFSAKVSLNITLYYPRSFV